MALVTTMHQQQVVVDETALKICTFLPVHSIKQFGCTCGAHHDWLQRGLLVEVTRRFASDLPGLLDALGVRCSSAYPLRSLGRLLTRTQMFRGGRAKNPAYVCPAGLFHGPYPGFMERTQVPGPLTQGQLARGRSLPSLFGLRNFTMPARPLLRAS